MSQNDPPTSDLLLTTELLHQAKLGDPAALDALMTRYLPRLYRWASGRLPMHARSLMDTSDLIQETLMKAIEALDGFESRGPGSFHAYMRQAIQNRILDQLRWARRRAGSVEVSEDLVDHEPLPLENAIGADLMARYENARSKLAPDEQLFLHLRAELDFSYEEIAAIMSRPSRDAARMGVQRAVRKLAEILKYEH